MVYCCFNHIIYIIIYICMYMHAHYLHMHSCISIVCKHIKMWCFRHRRQHPSLRLEELHLLRQHDWPVAQTRKSYFETPDRSTIWSTIFYQETAVQKRALKTFMTTSFWDRPQFSWQKIGHSGPLDIFVQFSSCASHRWPEAAPWNRPTSACSRDE
jgi:hypothetical protein